MTTQAPPHPSGTAGTTAAPMIWRRACVACTKAKRRCTKQVPACRRCAAKHIPCAYPPPRHVIEAETPPSASVITSSDDASMPLDPDYILDPSPAADHSLVIANIPAATGGLVDWFLAQGSFVPDHVAPDEILLDRRTNQMVDQLLHLVDMVKKWLQEWVTDGHSPLHHRQLYHTKMPRCVQDAYSTMALYFLALGSANRNGIFQLVDDRVDQMFEDQMREDLSSTAGAGSEARDLFGRLSRVQALVAYQIVRLFDGDIRMRARAEADMPTLTAWTMDLWARTRRSVSPTLGGDASTSPLNQSIPFDGVISLDGAVVTWKLWILTESIRRTWLASNLMMQVYHYIKHGWFQCAGSIAFTMREGLWEAETAYDWFAHQTRQDALFVPIFEHPAMMEAVGPGQVDEFGHAILGTVWGVERIARWHGDSINGSLGSPLAERGNGIVSA
ncbi:hypothetical protein PG996_013921 [Apiospora saccharicola]|uniref:Zn(2)-C6 fungal-type domain-containing protein n=1 Tax=Apiospora saccharicola TaxID=335842 RepID=A0ABR1TGX7_9PEZI